MSVGFTGPCSLLVYDHKSTRAHTLVIISHVKRTFINAGRKFALLFRHLAIIVRLVSHLELAIAAGA